MAQQATVRRVLRGSRPQGTTIKARTTVFTVKRKDENTSRQITDDEFLSLAGSAGAQIILPTPYNVPQLFQLIEQSNMLRQCIDAYVTNTVMTGWEVDSAVRGKEGRKDEINELQSFIDHANSDESLGTVMEKVIRDRESIGFGFHEIIRDATGNVALWRHAPAMSTRLCIKHPDEVPVTYDIKRGARTSSVTEYRRFRRIVQMVNGRLRYFKEYGDPRKLDYESGAFEGETGYNQTRQATEIYHWKNPSNEAYGIPRWVNQLPSIIGSRESEEVNMRYFKDNTVPPMFLLVSGGRLTQNSYRELTRVVNEDNLGADRQNKIMLLEAIGEGDSMDGKQSTIDLKVEKLTDARQSDGLFKEYDEANMAKVRSSFRLPPVVVGMSQDVNFATANTSVAVAESQVFAPARSQIDEVLNKQFVAGRSGLNLRSVKLVSRTPAITSPEMVVKTMTALNVMGALTPRLAQAIANKMLQIEIQPYPEKGEKDYEEWMDKPISFSNKPQPGAAQGATPDGKLPTSHDGQNQKDGATKKVEKTGTVEQTPPKHGEE